MRYRAAMSLVIEKTEAVPLTVDSDGVIRVSGTRVTLDTLAEAFHQGATAVEITQQYPGLSLADSLFGIRVFASTSGSDLHLSGSAEGAARHRSQRKRKTL